MKDPYIQSNGTLINKLGICDYDKLNNAEKDITFSKFLNIDNVFSPNFDIAYLQKIHEHIFQDIFHWAGQLRTIPIYKEEIVIPCLSLNYSDVSSIKNDLNNCLSKLNNVKWDSLSLDDKSSTFTDLLTELWRIHPFRDGNTRTTLTFASQFSKQHHFPLDISMLLDNLPRKYNEKGQIIQFSIRDKFVLSAIPKEYSPEPEHLRVLIKQSIISGVSQKIELLQNTLSDTDMEL